MFFGMGIWVAFVGLISMKSKILPKLFVAICIIKSTGFWIAHFGIISENMTIIIVGAIIGGLIGGPLYHIWLGLVMIKSNYENISRRKK
jgi:hypothetical protein